MGFIFIIIYVAILCGVAYAIIMTAVKNGIKEAYKELKAENAKTEELKTEEPKEL